MTRSQILKLQKIVDGQTYQESLIDEAIKLATTREVSHALKALRGGFVSTEGRFLISEFIVELLRSKQTTNK